MGGPNLRIDTDPSRCHQCGAPVSSNATAHRGHDGRGTFYLCELCEARMRQPAPPAAHPDAATFGVALNAVMAIRLAAESGSLPAEVAQQIRGLFVRFERQRAAVPLFGYEHQPAALIDFILPSASAQFRLQCLTELSKR